MTLPLCHHRRYTMEVERFNKHWKNAPHHVRKPIILTLGTIVLLAAAATGWLPGPGGIPLFLIGIAILSTEFEWAARVRDFILRIIHRIGAWIRQNPQLSAILSIILVSLWIGLMVYIFVY